MGKITTVTNKRTAIMNKKNWDNMVQSYIDTEQILRPVEQTSEKKETALDTQVGGSHYKNWKIQPIEFLQTNKVPPCEANVIKYICRHREKNGLEDLKKAKHYIDLLISLEYTDDID